jgi:hypothetical protein
VLSGSVRRSFVVVVVPRHKTTNAAAILFSVLLFVCNALALSLALSLSRTHARIPIVVREEEFW